MECKSIYHMLTSKGRPLRALNVPLPALDVDLETEEVVGVESSLVRSIA